MDVSADKCWELVLQRVNQQIVNDCKLDLEPIKRVIDGLEMCGLSYPAVVQVILQYLKIYKKNIFIVIISFIIQYLNLVFITGD